MLWCGHECLLLIHESCWKTLKSSRYKTVSSFHCPTNETVVLMTAEITHRSVPKLQYHTFIHYMKIPPVAKK